MKFIRLAAVAMAAAIVFGGSAQATDLRLLASWDSSYAAVGKVLEPFIEKMQSEVTDVKVTIMGPETVPPFEQLDPVARGLFDMLYTNGAYHFNDIAVGMALDAMTGDTETLRAAKVMQAVDEGYQSIGLKLIAVFYDMNGYHIMLKEPLGDDGLTGRRIRGTPIYHPVIEALGGAPVVLPGGEIYSALERGVIDGAAWPAVGAVAFKWYEVAGYYVRPTFGQVTHMLLMNLNTWNGLSDTQRAEIETVAQAFEKEANGIFDGLAGAEVSTLQEKGMQETKLSAEMIEKLSTAWFKGALDLAASKNPDEIANIRKLASEAGIGG